MDSRIQPVKKPHLYSLRKILITDLCAQRQHLILLIL